MDKISPLQKRNANKRNASLRRPSVLSWLRIMRIHSRIQQESAVELGELSTAQFDVLAQVGANEGIAQLDLARHLFVTQGNVTQLLDKMEARGWIQRVPDGRSKRLYLTPAGHDLFDAVVSPHEDFIAERFSALTDDEQRQLLRLLTKLDHRQAKQG